MIRNHPDALAIAAILVMLPGLWLIDHVGQGIRAGLDPIHRELRIEHDKLDIERDKLRMEADRFRQEHQRFRDELRNELRRTFRFRSI